MKHLIFIIACFLFFKSVNAQEVKEYVIENTKKIANIDYNFNDYSDLDFIVKSIGDAKIVMLGEQDHGDASTFLAKTRLIKYLHEEKGFNILAFENDFYGLTKGWKQLEKQPDSIANFLIKNLFPLWAYSKSCQYLLQEYIPRSYATESPLKVSGFDSQLWFEYSYNHLVGDFKKYLNATDFKIFETKEDSERFYELIQKLIEFPRTKTELSKAEETFLKNQFLKLKNSNKIDPYWNRIVQNLKSLIGSSNEIRDLEMARNLEYLVENNPEEKIIVWAANTHILKHTDEIVANSKKLDGVIFKNMGTIFTEDLGYSNDTYVIGFSSFEGKAGRIGGAVYDIPAPHKKGFENWIPENLEYAFIDFTKFNEVSNSGEAFLMKAPMHYTIPKRLAKIPWNLVYDGIFFIRNMKNAEKIETE